MRILPLAILAATLAFASPAALAADAAAAAGAQDATAPESQPDSPSFLAVVNGTVISAAEYEAAANEAARQKFYHGSPPEGAVEQLMREVADEAINRVLLLEEARRQGLEPDAAAVDEKIAQYDKRYGTSPRWQNEREQLLPPLRTRLEEDSLLAALEAQARRIPPPAEDKVRAYYKANPDKFTEPEKMRMSLILLKVDPSSPTAAWQAAEAEVGALRMQLTDGGADFAELAKQHSGDESAAKGGDLGYLHRGMLPEGIQEKIDEMKPGDLSPPTRVLEGYALFRYEALQPPKHHDFETVKARASDLLTRELSDKAWADFTAKLRQKAKIEINTQRYPALATQASGAR
jgi:parvulin-like peptidyl-prolyl isomerase